MSYLTEKYANTDPSLHYNHHLSDECEYQDHDLCRDQECACPHHWMPKAQHAPLKSCAEIASEESESEWEAALR